VEPAVRVPFIGLTGGMGAGKSEALSALSELGASTLSTDAVVHELLGSDEVRDALVARFGPDIAPGGVVDRGKVGERVFADPAEREWLEQQLWPRVGQRVLEWRDGTSGSQAAVVEVPLLFESDMEGVFDHTLAVVASDEVRGQRTAGRGHSGVDSRNERQLTQDEKAQRADFVIRNDGTREELKHSLSQVLAKIVT
jgi:dephospho-CoA kinase